MPKTTQLFNISTKVTSIIRNFFTLKTSGKSVAVTVLVAIVISSATTHIVHAETMGETAPETKEVLVDGMTVAERAAKIDAYFTAHGMPLAGQGINFVKSADAHGIDWRLLAAISVIESTGGLHACKKATYSAFGFGSCKMNFPSYEQSIETVSAHLGGDVPTTARHYDGKDTIGILSAYNQVRHDYKKIVLGTMNQISKIDAPAVLAMK